MRVPQVWMVFVWAMLVFPVTIPLAAFSARAVLTARWDRRPIGLRRPSPLLALGAIIAIWTWGEVWFYPGTRPLQEVGWQVRTLYVILAVQAVAALVAIWRSPKPRWRMAAVMVAALWVGIISAFVAQWSILSGGSLGAL